MAADKYSGEQLWEVLYELAPVKRPKPPSTLYDVIVDGADLDAVKRYVAGGHDLCQQFACFIDQADPFAHMRAAFRD